MLADEPRDAPPVPERLARQERTVGLRRVHVHDDGLRHIPALPSCTRRPVAEIDVFAVEPVTLVETAQLVEQLASKEKECAEHPLGLDRASGTLVELVVGDLPLLRVD